MTASAALAAAAGEHPAPAAADPPLALVGGRIYPDPSGLPIFDGAVVVAEGRIAAVGPREEVAIPAGATVVDCSGLVIVAGFQNSHVHFTEPKWADAAAQPAASLTAHLEAMLTRFGFTTVLDTGSLLSNTAALRRRIEAGEVAGPRILTAGAPLYPPAGVPFYLRETLPPEVLPLLPQPETPEQATALVSRQLDEGADAVKLFTGSWVERGRVLPMPRDVAAAAAAEAHRRGKPVLTHASSVAGLEVALAAGADIVAHALDDVRDLTPAHLAAMREHGVALIPTLALFAEDRWLFEIGDAVRDFARGGGELLFGTDVGYLSEYDPTGELLALTAAGLGWREILAMLTTNPAARFGEANRRGRVAAGLDADLVVLGGDPARDVRAFADVRHVVRGGRPIYGPAAAGR